MKALTKDAKGFVEAIVSHLEDDKKQSVVGRVRSLLSKVSAQAKKEKSASVVSSITLTTAQEAQIERILIKLMGHPMDVEYGVNPSLIAGLTIRVADWHVDTSFRGQLEMMKQSLLT